MGYWFNHLCNEFINELTHELFNELIKKLASELDPTQIKKPICLTLFFLNENIVNMSWGVSLFQRRSMTMGEQVKAALSGKNGVLTCCTYKHQEEVDAAHKIIKQLRDLTGTIMIILAAHLVPQLGPIG